MLDVKIDDTTITKGIAYKDREETVGVFMVFHPIESTPEEIYREQRLKLMFDMGVHFLVYPDGTVYQTLPTTAHADILYDHTEDGIYIMLVGCGESQKEMTDCAKHSVNELLKMLGYKTCTPEEGA